MPFEIWDPWEDMRRMRKRMGRMFDISPSGQGEGAVREPLVDLVDKGNEYEVMVEMPGLNKEDIKINVEPRSVSIGAEQKTEQKEEEEEKGYFFHERSYSSFFRRIPLPEEIVPGKADAEYKNGVLEITLEKKEPQKPEDKGFRVRVK